MKIQWQGDNLAEIQRALASYGHVFELDVARRVVRIVAHTVKGGLVIAGTEIDVRLGDAIEIRRGHDGLTDSVGIHRLPSPEAGDPEVTWKGDNLAEIASFIRQHECETWADGPDAIVQMPQGEQVVRVHRGDKLFRRGGKYLFVRRAGKDHRL